MGGVIIVWLLFSSTHSPFTITLLGIANFIPTLTIGILAGALIDRYDRRRLMILADLVRAAAMAVLATYVLFFGFNAVVILAVVLVVAAFSSIFRPATNAILPNLLAKKEVTDGNGLLQAGSTAAQFVGSPVGGLLIVTVGVLSGLIYNAVTFAISAAMLGLMVIPSIVKGPPTSAGRTTSLLREVRDGFRFLRSQRALLNITLAAMAANFFLAMWGLYEVVYVVNALHLGATAYGILLGANTAGFGIGSLLPGRLHTDRRPGIWFSLGWAAAGVGILVLGLVLWFPLSVALFLMIGIFSALGNTTWLSGVQQTVPDEFLGRYFATDEAGSFAMIPAGQVTGGALIFAIGIAPTYLLAGVGNTVASLLLLLSAEVRAWGRPSSKPTALVTSVTQPPK